jgi:hypothetical protein
VVLLVDVTSGINTSDEMDILKFVVDETKRHSSTRDIRTIVVANKSDDMQWDSVTKRLIMEGELETMFEQVVSTVARAFEEAGISDSLIGVAPLCALDAYLYRMIHKHGADFKLSSDQILKIGVNESGKKFSKLPRSKQEKEVAEIVQKGSFLDYMILLSGFAGFQSMLKTHVLLSYKGDQISNILATLSHFNVDAEIAPFLSSPWLFRAVPNGFPWSAVKAHLTAYEKIRTIDETIYQEKVKKLLEKLSAYIYVYKRKIIVDCDTETEYRYEAYDTILAYDKFCTFVQEIFPTPNKFVETGQYPSFICEEVAKQLAGVPRYGLDQLQFFSYMKQIGRLSEESVTAYVNDRFLNTSCFSICYNDHSAHVGQRASTWSQTNIDQLVDTLIIIESVLGPSDLMVEVTRYFWAAYSVKIKSCPEEHFKRRVLHFSHRTDPQAAAILLQDGIPCNDVSILTKTLDLSELRSDGNFKLDFFLFDLLERRDIGKVP